MAVPALLDLLGLPYTGSGALALGLALHKDKAKELLVARGVPTPAFRVVERLAELDGAGPSLPAHREALPRGRIGGHRLRLGGRGPSAASSDAVRRVLRTFHQPALVERFVPGREVYVRCWATRPAARCR